MNCVRVSIYTKKYFPNELHLLPPYWLDLALGPDLSSAIFYNQQHGV